MESEWEYTITRCNNGFCVVSTEELNDGTCKLSRQVFEELEFTEWAEHDAWIRCMRWLTEQFGLGGSKHDKRRIRIDLEDQ